MFLYFCNQFEFVMYITLLFLHSLIRWLVLISLIFAIIRSGIGYSSKLKFTKGDNHLRHWTATFAQIQMVIGMILYTQSPWIKMFWTDFSSGLKNSESLFFSLIHIALMLAAVGVITTGSSMAKRVETDRNKFRIMLVWFTIALVLIVIAIPWPFSPLANRPYLR